MDHLEEFHGDLIEGAACESEECVQMRQRDEQLGSPGSHPQQEQTYTITEAPSTLVINLKRGQFDKRSFQSYKLKDDVPFDEELDLSRFTAGNTALKYRLYGVIAHSGPQPNYGHWIAVVRHRNGTEYRTISDSRIRRGHPADDFEEMEYPAWGTDADGKAELFEPTVLVYQKIQED